jgi:hypothetical protein
MRRDVKRNAMVRVGVVFVVVFVVVAVVVKVIVLYFSPLVAQARMAQW